jgi:hypothetical protein
MNMNKKYPNLKDKDSLYISHRIHDLVVAMHTRTNRAQDKQMILHGCGS